jgi:hypothetical protein
LKRPAARFDVDRTRATDISHIYKSHLEAISSLWNDHCTALARRNAVERSVRHDLCVGPCSKPECAVWENIRHSKLNLPTRSNPTLPAHAFPATAAKQSATAPFMKFFCKGLTMMQLTRRFRSSGQRTPSEATHETIQGVSRSVLARLAALPMVVLAATILSACASSNTTSLINLPNGQTGFAVNCSGADADSSWASCYVQAGQACGATGYDIISKDNDEGGAAGGSVTNVVSANVKNRSMIVRCK